VFRGKCPQARCSLTVEDNIKMGLEENVHKQDVAIQWRIILKWVLRKLEKNLYSLHSI
jgi:hypothetical protein